MRIAALLLGAIEAPHEASSQLARASEVTQLKPTFFSDQHRRSCQGATRILIPDRGWGGWGGLFSPRALATSGRRPGVRAKRAARGVAGRHLWTGRREKTGHPFTAIMNRMPLNSLCARFSRLNAIFTLIYRSFWA